MPVTLQFVDDGNVVGSVIKYVTHGWATHVDVVVPAYCLDKVSDDGLPFTAHLLGSRPQGGVSVRETGYKDFKRIARVDLNLTSEQEGKFYEFLKKQVGKTYDFANVAGFVDGVTQHDDGKWFCSALILGALNAVGFFPYHLAKQDYEIDPEELLLVCSAFAPIRWIKK